MNSNSISGRSRQFFAELTRGRRLRPLSVVILVHAAPGAVEFLNGLSHVGRVRLVLVKPHSIDPEIFEAVSRQFATRVADRNDFLDPPTVVGMLRDAVGEEPFVVVDVGGYFAKLSDHILDTFKEQFLGVVEETENGIRRYEAASPRAAVISVARSSLKQAEDFLVGGWVTHSFESILRREGLLLQDGLAAVVGYGKIGSSVAMHLRGRSRAVRVVEVNPVRKVLARAHGFEVVELERALRDCHFMVSASGRQAMSADHFKLLRRGAYVASVTSADDEFDMSGLDASFERVTVSPFVERLEWDRSFFFLINRGNAVNFVTKGGMGDYLLPVHGEIVMGVSLLAEGCPGNGIIELPIVDQESVANAWLNEFASSHDASS